MQLSKTLCKDDCYAMQYPTELALSVKLLNYIPHLTSVISREGPWIFAQFISSKYIVQCEKGKRNNIQFPSDFWSAKSNKAIIFDDLIKWKHLKSSALRHY